MQLRNQGPKTKNWKVVAAVATASALGVSGLALADTGGPESAPGAINLRDRAEISQINSQLETPQSDVPLLIVDNTNDSPFDDNSAVTGDAETVSAMSGDSPDPDPAESISAQSVSAQSATAQSATVDSGSADSFDESASS
jgi:hypothetical protein